MAKIFISYDRASKDVVEELVKDLTADDHKIWFDQHLTGGHKWWDNILSEIRKCEIFVAALTPASLDSRACQREAKYAKDVQRILLPVRLSDKVSPNSLPPELSELQWVDYTRLDKQALISLQRTLRNLSATPPLPDPLPDLPPVPISYLSSLRAKIETDTQLQLQDQIQLLFELRRQIRNGDPAKEIMDLLQRLKNRGDLFAVVSQDIDDLIRDIGREFPIGDRIPPPEPEPPGLDEDDEPPKPLFAAAPVPPEPSVLDLPVRPSTSEVLPGSGGGGELSEAKKIHLRFLDKKAIFTISLLAIIVAIIGFFSITQPSQSPNAFPLQADIISSTYPLQVKVLGAIYTVSDRKLKFDLKITNAGKKPVRLGEFQSAGVRFLNPDVYTSKLSYPENLVADHGLSLSDDSPIPPGATRELTVSIQDTRQSDRLSYDVNKSPPSLLYFFDPLGSRYEVDIGGFVRTRS
jgi:hypothetical protein